MKTREARKTNQAKKFADRKSMSIVEIAYGT